MSQTKLSAKLLGSALLEKIGALSLGSAGQVLRVNSGGTAPEFATPTGLSFYAAGNFAHNFPSIAANGGVQYVDVAVTGALTVGHVGMANSNSLSDGVVLSARITATGNLRIFATNPTGGAIDPGLATLSWVVIG